MGSITDVPGIRVGHWQNEQAMTGCTVILVDGGAIGGVDVRGGAPGTRETDLLSPLNTVEKVNAILLSGGSAFGLDAAGGVMRFLEERNQGHPVGKLVVPIVPGAVIYDLGLGDSQVRPGNQEGYTASEQAGSEVQEGSYGAGCGATVGNCAVMNMPPNQGRAVMLLFCQAV
jgi:L-aminopeptidase/D-esterase-like protein